MPRWRNLRLSLPQPPAEAEDGDKVVVAQLGSHPTAQLLSPYLCLQGGQNRQHTHSGIVQGSSYQWDLDLSGTVLHTGPWLPSPDQGTAVEEGRRSKAGRSPEWGRQEEQGRREPQERGIAAGLTPLIW